MGQSSSAEAEKALKKMESDENLKNLQKLCEKNDELKTTITNLQTTFLTSLQERKQLDDKHKEEIEKLTKDYEEKLRVKDDELKKKEHDYRTLMIQETMKLKKMTELNDEKIKKLEKHYESLLNEADVRLKEARNLSSIQGLEEIMEEERRSFMMMLNEVISSKDKRIKYCEGSLEECRRMIFMLSIQLLQEQKGHERDLEDFRKMRIEDAASLLMIQEGK